MFSYESDFNLGLSNQNHLDSLFSWCLLTWNIPHQKWRMEEPPNFTFLILFDWWSAVLHDAIWLEKHFVGLYHKAWWRDVLQKWKRKPVSFSFSSTVCIGLREISISQSSITHLTSSAWNFQANPMATWADEISQLTTGKVFSKWLLRIFYYSWKLAHTSIRKLWHYDLLEWETVVSTVAADMCICSMVLLEQKDLTPKLVIENAI